MRGITQESTQKDTLLRGFTITNDQNEKLEFIKNPIVTEFLGISSDTDFTESALEKAFYRISKSSWWNSERTMPLPYDSSTFTPKSRITMFYNHILKCFVLIDL